MFMNMTNAVIGSIFSVASLAPGATIAVTVGIDFNDTTQPASFNLW